MFGTDNSTKRRLQELETRFLHLENEYKALKLDWENAYDKLLSMMQRVSKRAQVLQREMDGGEPPLSDSELALQVNREAGTGRPSLTPAQMRANAAVEARRRSKVNGEG